MNRFASNGAPEPSGFASWLLRRCLGPGTLARRAFRLARKAVLPWWHPPFEGEYFGQKLVFPAHHDLLLLNNDLPWFNTPMRRLAQMIRLREGGLRLIDIGANIGEGVPLVDPGPSDTFWLIEGSGVFVPFLRRNVGNRPDTTIIDTYLGAEDAVVRGSEVIVAGNARVEMGSGSEISFQTLDALFPETSAARPNFLKIDVEGHELRIFKGGRRMLERLHPVVFMEWFPELLSREGAEAMAPLDFLAGCGYDQLMVYDNHGYLLANLAIGDRDPLERLARYSRMRPLFYYDVVVFGPSHSELRETFRRDEDDLLRRRAAVALP